MANLNIIGTTNCVRCGALVNLKRDKKNKAYYFCTGEASEEKCGKREWEGVPLSNRIIAVAARHSGLPHFTRYEFVDGKPVVEIKQEIKQETKIDNIENEPEERKEEPTSVGTTKSDNNSAGSSGEWPYV